MMERIRIPWFWGVAAFFSIVLPTIISCSVFLLAQLEVHASYEVLNLYVWYLFSFLCAFFFYFYYLYKKSVFGPWNLAISFLLAVPVTLLLPTLSFKYVYGIADLTRHIYGVADLTEALKITCSPSSLEVGDWLGCAWQFFLFMLDVEMNVWVYPLGFLELAFLASRKR